MPYLPVYYHSLGHGGSIIGLLGAVKPFTSFCVAPLWASLIQNTRNSKSVWQWTFAVSLLTQLFVALRKEASWIFVCVGITALVNAPVKSLLDSMVLDHVPSQQYGRLRLWGQLGFGIGSSGAGMLLSSAASSKTGYNLLFVTYLMLSLPTWLCMQGFDTNSATSKQKAVKNKRSKPKTLSKKKNNKAGNDQHLLFFGLVLMIGISSGVIENFAYVRLREVGGTGRAMGISRLVSSLAGAPMFWWAAPLLERFGGVDRVLIGSILVYALRFTLYASMKTPWQGLPAEGLRGLTFALFWSASTIHAHRIGSATALLLLNAMYGGLGQSVGALVGGKFQELLGTRRLFYYAAIVDVAFVSLLLLIGYPTESFRNNKKKKFK